MRNLRKIIQEEGDKIVNKCYQCGECGSVCTIGYVRKEYSPRKIIYELIIGNEDIFESEMLWWCAGCHLCSETCSKNVEPEEILIIARNYACKSDNRCPGRIRMMADSILKNGAVLPVIGRAERYRGEMNLNPIKKVDVEEIRKITNFRR